MGTPFRTRYDVRFADVDNAGIFYFPRFFHAFHVAFEEFWRKGAERPYHIVIQQDKVGFPAVHIESDFKKPVSFGDPMEITVGLKRMGRTSLVFRYEMIHAETGEVHVAAEITTVLVDMTTFKAIEPPDWVREKLEPIRLGNETR